MRAILFRKGLQGYLAHKNICVFVCVRERKKLGGGQRQGERKRDGDVGQPRTSLLIVSVNVSAVLSQNQSA